jgi:hypothetical protein
VTFLAGLMLGIFGAVGAYIALVISYWKRRIKYETAMTVAIQGESLIIQLRERDTFTVVTHEPRIDEAMEALFVLARALKIVAIIDPRGMAWHRTPEGFTPAGPVHVLQMEAPWTPSDPQAGGKSS